MRAMIDTNILIDYFGKREPYFHSWKNLFIMQQFGDIELWVAPQSFEDAFCILRKMVDSQSLQSAFNDSLGIFNVCSFGMEEIREATKRAWTDFEDCVISICAENIDADVLLSRDKDGFRNSKVPALTIDELFDHLESELGIVYDEVDI